MLRNLIEDHSAHYWIGMTDIEDDGKFHLLDGDAYDASDLTQQSLYYWYPGDPNNNKGALWTFIHSKSSKHFRIRACQLVL